MSPSGAEVLRQIKTRIAEVDPATVREQVSNGAVVVDVREAEEWSAGHIPGAKHVPKSYLETRIEGAAPDRDQHVILYCQSGNRSAWAARTLIEDLGYTNVELDDRRLHAVEGPRLRGRGAADAHRRAARALLAPPAPPGGRDRGPAEAARRQGPAARRRRARIAHRALPGGRRRRHARHRRQRRRRPLEPAAPGDPLQRADRRAEGRLRRGDDPRAQPRRARQQVRPAARGPRTSWTSCPATTWSSTAWTTSRRGTCSTTPRCGLASRSSRPRSSASTVSCRSSGPTTVRATAASSRCRRRPSWPPRAAPTASSACCRARWACSRPPR